MLFLKIGPANVSNTGCLKQNPRLFSFFKMHGDRRRRKFLIKHLKTLNTDFQVINAISCFLSHSVVSKRSRNFLMNRWEIYTFKWEVWGMTPIILINWLKITLNGLFAAMKLQFLLDSYKLDSNAWWFSWGSFLLFFCCAIHLSLLAQSPSPHAGEREIEKNIIFPLKCRLGLTESNSNVDRSSGIYRNAGCRTALRCRVRCLNRFSCFALLLFTTSGFESDFLHATAILLVCVCAALDERTNRIIIKSNRLAL